MDSLRRIRYLGSHLACFNGGNWIYGESVQLDPVVILIILAIGGKLLNNDTIVQIGLELVDGCWNTYASTA